MHFSSWLTLAFSTSVIARPEGIIDQVGSLRVRDAQDSRNLPAVKSALETAIKDGAALDKAISPLTKANSATQVDVIIKALDKFTADTSASAASISKSGAIGLLEISGLLNAKNQQVWKDLNSEVLKIFNQTTMDIVAKKDITKDLPPAKLAALTKAIRGQKKGIMELMAVIPGQIPPAVKTQLENQVAKQAGSASASGCPTPKMPNLNDPETKKKLSSAIDSVLDQVVNVVSGKQEAFNLPPGAKLPAGLNFPAFAATEAAPGAAPGADGACGTAAAPKTSTSKGTSKDSATKGSAASKDSATKGSVPKDPARRRSAVDFIERRS